MIPRRSFLPAWTLIAIGHTTGDYSKNDMTKIILETDRLCLREMTEDDAAHIFKLNSNPNVVRYVGEPTLNSEEEALNILRTHVFPQYHTHRVGRWAVILKETSAFIGWSGLKFLAKEQEYDLGYRFLEEYWGRGYATEAAQAVLDYGRQNFPGARIVGKAMVENHASTHVLEKIGMRLEGYSQEHDGTAVVYIAV